MNNLIIKTFIWIILLISLKSYSQEGCWNYNKDISVGCLSFKDSKSTHISIDFVANCEDGGDLKILIQKKDLKGIWRNKTTLTIKKGKGNSKFSLDGVKVNETHYLRYYAYNGRVNTSKIDKESFYYHEFFLTAKVCSRN